MYEGKYRRVFSFPWGEVTVEDAGSQWHLDSCHQFIWSQLQWFGLQETLIWVITAPKCHPPFCGVLSCPVCDWKSLAQGELHKYWALRLRRELGAEKDKLIFLFPSILYIFFFGYSLSSLRSPECFWSERSLPSPTSHASGSITQNLALAVGRSTSCPPIFLISFKAGPVLVLFEWSNLSLAQGKNKENKPTKSHKRWRHWDIFQGSVSAGKPQRLPWF